MSANKEKPHLLVLPEDDANRQLANGFHLQVDWTQNRQMQVLVPAGGWIKVLERFETDHVFELDKYPKRLMLLLIDLDGRDDRLGEAKARIPQHLAQRVFILGVRTEPEDLKRARLCSYETIGAEMAKDCREGSGTIWAHELLQHNAEELARLRTLVRPILFP